MLLLYTGVISDLLHSICNKWFETVGIAINIAQNNLAISLKYFIMIIDI